MKWIDRWFKIDTISVPEAAREIAATQTIPPSALVAATEPPPPVQIASPARTISLTLIDLLDYVRDAATIAEAKRRRRFYLDAARLILHEPAADRLATQDAHHDAPRHVAQAPAWRSRVALRNDGLEDRQPREGFVSADETPAERDEREYQQTQREEYEATRLARMNGGAQHPEDEAG